MFVHSDFLTVAHASVKYKLGKDSILLSSGLIWIWGFFRRAKCYQKCLHHV